MVSFTQIKDGKVSMNVFIVFSDNFSSGSNRNYFPGESRELSKDHRHEPPTRRRLLRVHSHLPRQPPPCSGLAAEVPRQPPPCSGLAAEVPRQRAAGSGWHVISPTLHWSDLSMFRKIGPTAHSSDLGPTAHCSDLTLTQTPTLTLALQNGY